MRARTRDRRVYLASHPVLFALLAATRHRPALRLGRTVLAHDRDAFVAALTRVPLDRTAEGTTGGAAGRLTGAGRLFDQHGDEHRRTRRDTAAALGPAGVARLRPLWTELLARRLAPLGDGRTVDLVPLAAELSGVTTANWARDMDHVRAALGEARISFLGYSYGTYLGAVYRTMFPRHADRFVLDSSYDPTLSRYGQLRLAALGATLRLPDFTAWAAARNDRYHLGATPAAVRRTYDALVARLDRTPLGEINGNIVRILTFEALYSDASFPLLAEQWADLVAGTATPAPERTARTGIPDDNQPSVQVAIHCNDERWPRDIDTYRRNVALERRLFPAFAGFASNIWPCAFWPLPQREPAVRVGPTGRRGVLVVQNLRDPATPWIGAAGMRRALGSDAELLTVDQGGHGVYLLTGSACADDTVNAFLARGDLPDAPVRCRVSRRGR